MTLAAAKRPGTFDLDSLGEDARPEEWTRSNAHPRKWDGEMNSAWWKTAHQAPVGDDPPGDVSSVTFAAHLWTPTWKTLMAEAELYTVPGVGVDLRYTIDGELRATDLFKGVDGGTEATLQALDKRTSCLRRGGMDDADDTTSGLRRLVQQRAGCLLAEPRARHRAPCAERVSSGPPRR